MAVTKHHQQVLEIARTLHQQRQQYTEEPTQLTTDSMHALSMSRRQSTIDVKFDEYHLGAGGADCIEFWITTNPDQPVQPTVRVAPGGELFRIALIVQVITAHKVETSALIFDEVNVGISGSTAAVIGKLLHQLGKSTQVMCVTHLPQVVGCDHQHYSVGKGADGAITETRMQSLNKEAQLQEPARLLDDSEITCNTLANAKELPAA